MVVVSNGWVNAHGKALLPETFLEITYSATEPGAQQSASSSGTNEAEFSDATMLASTFNKVPEKYATLEGFGLDGTYEYFYGKYHNPSRIAVPLYLHTKFRFMKTRVAPFLSASGGFMFTGHVDSEGNRSGHDSDYGSFRYDTYYKNGADVVYYADIMFGIDIRFRNESSLTLGLGPIFTGQDDDYPSVYSSEYEEETRAVGGFRLGYSF